MSITLPQQDPKILIAKAVAYMKGLKLDITKKSDMDYAICMVDNIYKLCPDSKSGFTGIEITSNVRDTKINLTRDSKKSVKQILDGLKLLKNGIKLYDK